MATYLSGVTDYIPQLQVFQPDYNFLGNMLQNAQSKYDKGHAELSKTYSTLLNSPMLREDNMTQRNDFFKMIDQDIKKISGMDLSLQQNVDSANKVFDSFYQNKELVKDMTFTKNYQNQLDVAERFRNCTNEKDCGGKYWEEGVNALHYKADEFKKASRQDTLGMDVGRYVPAVNIQEKVTEYAKSLLGTNGAFGVETVVPSADGRWQVTLKNGSLLSTPLQQILLNQYGKDQDIIDMHNVQSYVNRKSFIAANAEKLGGEAQAENEYFNTVTSSYIEKNTRAYSEANILYNKTRAYKDKLEDQLKKYGSAGNDELEAAIVSANFDLAASKESLNYHESSLKSIQDLKNSTDVNSKRNVIDKMLGRDMMTKSISDSAINVANLTGQKSQIVDPYAKSAFDFHNDMHKLEREYQLKDDLDLKHELRDLDKQKALEDYKKQGSISDNTGVFKQGTPGTSTESESNIQNVAKANINSAVNTAVDAGEKFAAGYGNTLVSVINNTNADKKEVDLARATLLSIYGAASKGVAGYDEEENVFKDKNGVVKTEASEIIDHSNWSNIYKKAKLELNKNKVASDIHKSYANGEGSKFEETFDEYSQLFKIQQNSYKNNNDAVRKHGLTTLDDKAGWDNYFRNDHTIKNFNEYEKDYLEKYKNTNVDYYELKSLAKKSYEKASENYDKIYNAGNTINGEPIVKGIDRSMGLGTGAYSAGGSTIYTFNSASPSSLGTAGLVSAYKDALQGNSIFTMGLHNNINEISGEDSETAKVIMNTVMTDIAAGGKPVVGQVEYLDLALSDKNKIAVRFILSAEFVKNHKGTAENPSIFEDPALLTKGVTMYMDKSTAKNTFTQSFQQSPRDIIHKNYDMTVNKPSGSITILKPNANGEVFVNGSLNVPTTDGGFKVQVLNNQFYGTNVKGSEVWNNINQMLEQNQQLINKVHDSVPKQKFIIRVIYMQ